MSTLPDLKSRYQVVVIGGGVHGAAAALEAASRGRDVLLVEQHDFCSGTSANSLKIIHGGLRYLQSLDLRRSRESAREQSRLLRRAPHLVAPLPCLMGTERSLVRGRLPVALGLWLYDNVIRLGLPDHPRGRLLSAGDACRLAGRDLFRQHTGAALWYDAQAVDTERLVLTYLKTAERAGARILNYTSATNVDYEGTISVALRDAFTGERSRVTADVVIDTASFLAPHPGWARAANLVLGGRFLDCAVALRLPGRPADADRLFFAAPNRDAVLIGTWYFADRDQSPYRLSRAELDRCLADVRSMLPGVPIADRDLATVHVGRLPVSDADRPLSLVDRPIIRAVAGDPRVMSVTGVKFTTAAATAAKALRLAGLPAGRPADGAGAWYGAASTRETVATEVRGVLATRLDEAEAGPVADRLCRQYGSVAVDIARAALDTGDGLERIPGCHAVNAEILYCIEHEHCRTVSDFLLRRSGIGSLAAPPPGAAEHCAGVMARHFGWSEARVADELNELSARYRHVSPEL